jgi:hypothetical protein
LENSEWVSSESMNQVRSTAAITLLQDGSLLVTGGQNSSFPHNSAEMLSKGGWENKIPSFPVTIDDHCMVNINSTTVMIIGGTQNGQRSGKTFYFTFGEQSWTDGPELKYSRFYHSCQQIRRNQDIPNLSIIVVGGWDGSSELSSVEILDEDSNEWRTGPELPIAIRLSQMVEDQNGGVVFIGGRSSNANLDTLYQLPHGGQDAVWTKMDQTLKGERSEHTTFLVPDNIFKCF